MEQDKGEIKREIASGTCSGGGSWMAGLVRDGEGEYPSSSPSAKAFSYQEMLKATGPSLVPSSFPIALVMFLKPAPAPAHLTTANCCFFSPSASRWEIGKTPLHRYPQALWELYNHEKSPCLCSSCRSASHSYLCCSPLFSK